MRRTRWARSWRICLLALAMGTMVTLPSAGPADIAGAASGAILNYAEDLTVTGSGPLSLDPASTSGSPVEASFDALIYDDLIRQGTSGSGLLEPGLATSWRIPDPETIQLTLRQGVRFQDGSPFNADAVVFNMQRDMTSLKSSPYASNVFPSLVGASATGPYSVMLSLNQPEAYSFLSTLLTGWTGWIASPTAVRTEGASYAQHPVGAGPYRLSSFTPDQEVSVRRWPGFWQGSGCEPYSSAHNCWRLAGVNFIQTTAGSPQVAALRSGQVQYVRVTTSSVYNAVRNVPGIGITKAPSATGMNYFRVCTNKAPFTDPRLDRAIGLALDRNAINLAASGGLDVPTDQLNPPGSGYSSPNLRAQHNLPLAKKLVRQAHAVGMTFQIGYPQFEVYTNTSQVLQAQLQQIGLDVRLEPSINVVNDLLVQKKYAAVILATITPGSAALIQGFVPQQLSNFCDYSNPLFTTAFNTFKSSVPSASWAALWKQINTAVYNGSLIFPLYYFSNTGAYNSSQVGGVYWMQDNGDSGLPDFQTMFMRGS